MTLNPVTGSNMVEDVKIVEDGDTIEDDINMVSIAVKVSVKENKTVKEVEKDLVFTKLKVWDKISGFDVEEEIGNFIVTVSCIRRDNPDKFTVARAVSLLKSGTEGFSPNRPTGPIRSSSRNVRVSVCLWNVPFPCDFF